jgi:hypothetical protein
VIIQLRVVILGVDSVLNIGEGPRGYIGALAFKDRLKKVLNLVRAVPVESVNLSALVIIISAGSLFIENPKISEEVIKLINISVKDCDVNRLGLLNMGRRGS